MVYYKIKNKLLNFNGILILLEIKSFAQKKLNFNEAKYIFNHFRNIFPNNINGCNNWSTKSISC